jgi:hypothetical protein
MDDWEALAACRGKDPELFHDGDRSKEAIAVCVACPVWAECVLANRHEQMGVWGCSERCRRRLRKLTAEGASDNRLLALAAASNAKHLGLAGHMVNPARLVPTSTSNPLPVS